MPEILFDREQILVVDKSEGLATLPEQNSLSASLLELLQGEYGERLYVVHRLDKPVSGVILFAKDARTHRWLNDQFQSRQVHKTYLALVHGRISQKSGMIDKPLRQFGSGRVAVDWKRGKACRTDYQGRERPGDFSFLHVYPLTGRRHQIRTHFYSIDHPIVGDPLYGDKQRQCAFPRMMLHAEAITFRTPSGEQMNVVSNAPESFRAILDQVRQGDLDGIKPSG